MNIIIDLLLCVVSRRRVSRVDRTITTVLNWHLMLKVAISWFSHLFIAFQFMGKLCSNGSKASEKH